MRPDPNYIKRLLDAFESSEADYADMDGLRERGIDIETVEFIFHMRILGDRGLVERVDEKQGLGITRGADGETTLNTGIALRLTDDGHSFALHLLGPSEVSEKVRSVIVSSGMEVAVQLATSIAAQYTAKVLGLTP